MSRVGEILDELKSVHDAKNHDYAGESGDPFANFRLSEMVGVAPHVGVLIRMGDKYARLCNLFRYGNQQVKGESVKDTARDLAVYSCILVALIEEWESKGMPAQSNPFEGIDWVDVSKEQPCGCFPRGVMFGGAVYDEGDGLRLGEAEPVVTPVQAKVVGTITRPPMMVSDDTQPWEVECAQELTAMGLDEYEPVAVAPV